MTYNTLFLDRDGVLNLKIENGYVLSEQDIQILPGIPEFLQWAHQQFTQIIVVTNQRCVNRNMISMQKIEAINRTINEKTGNHISSFFVCPHLNEQNCNCRKPKNGLFLAAANRYNVDFTNSWMVGDSESDLIPARKLGMKTIFIAESTSQFADVTVSSAADLLAALEHASNPNQKK